VNKDRDADTPVVEVRNPADGSIVGVVADMSADQVLQVAAELRSAQPAWEALGPKGRAHCLRRWLDWIVDSQDEILGLMQREAGKSWGDAQIELLVCMEVINYYTKHGGEFLAEETRRRTDRRRQPRISESVTDLTNSSA
jgi:acyl-CoA reductase-like NAD-dependent aldehyde dehydrogenase